MAGSTVGAACDAIIEVDQWDMIRHPDKVALALGKLLSLAPDRIHALEEMLAPLSGEVYAREDEITIFPATHYVTTPPTIERAAAVIREELEKAAVKVGVKVTYETLSAESGQGGVIVIVFADGGDRYLSSGLYRQRDR